MASWEDILHQAGYPTTILTLDFETYFSKDYTLKKLSAIEYVCDPRFEVTGLGMQRLEHKADQASQFFEPEEVEEILNSIAKNDRGLSQYTVVCQNSKFDCLILKEHFRIVPKYTIDLIDLERMWDSRTKHSLEAMAKRWGSPTVKGDTNQFKGYRWNDMSPEMRKDLADYCKNDVDIETYLLQKLLPLIPNPEIELPLATQTLQLFLNPQIKIDIALGEKLKRGMRLEVLKPRLELRKLGVPASKTSISKNKKFVELLNSYTDVPMKPGKNGLIPALAKDDEGLRDLLVHPKPEVRLLAEARQKLKSWPLHIARVESLINQAKARGGLIGAPLNFHAAHTGRWGGTEKINLQNLAGEGRGGAAPHQLIQQIRKMLVAPPGYVFGMLDYAQIQARIVAWLAGQHDLVQDFADGVDIYSNFMRETFGWYVRKPADDDPPPVARLLRIRRGFGKDTILGRIFGLGTGTAFDRAKANKDIRPMIDSGECSWDFFDKLTKTFRKKYSKIPEFWSSIEKAWRFVTKFTSETYDYFVERSDLKYCGQPIHCRTSFEPLLKFHHEDGATFITLPSGRFLRYPQAKVRQDGKLGYRWRSNIWGGFLTENLAQAIEVDIVGEALLRLEKVGANVVLHTHDDITFLFEKDRAEEDMKKMSRIMSIIPDWAHGLPIAVEGKLCERYEK